MRAIIFLLLVFTCTLFSTEAPPQMQLSTYEKIQEVQKLMESSQYDTIEKVLKTLEADELEPIDKAYTYLYFGYFYTITERYKKAGEYYEKAVALAILPKAQNIAMLNSLYQIYMSEQHYVKAIQKIDILLHVDKKDEKYYIYRANANLASENLKATIKDLNLALAITKEPKERWYKILYYCYFELELYTKAKGSVQKLLKLHPQNKNYWLYLSTLHTLLKEYDKAFENLQIAYAAEVVDSESLYLQLVHSLRYYKMPYESAVLLDVKLEDNSIQSSEKNLELLGDTYYEAREFSKAIDSYIKATAFSKHAKIEYKIVQIYAQMRRYNKVIEFSNRAISKDAISTPWVYIQLGSAYFEVNDKEKALAAFKKAATFKKIENEARKWIRYIKSLPL